MAPAAPQHVDVVVVGAGAAGMSAATRLLALSNLTVAVLEARAYTGGRVHARRFGVGTIIEEGANWVHGEPPPGTSSRLENPAWQLAGRARLNMTRIPGSCANTSGYAVYDADGGLYANVGGAPQRRADAAFACANLTGQRLRPGRDMSFADALAQCGFAAPPTGTAEDTLFWEATAANLPLPIDQESLFWALPDPTYQFYGRDDHFVHDQRARGYATALDAMLTPQDVARRWKESLHLSAVVTGIDAEPGAGECLTTTATTLGGHAEENATACARAHQRRSPVLRSTRRVHPPAWRNAKDHAKLFTSPPLPASKIRGMSAL